MQRFFLLSVSAFLIFGLAQAAAAPVIEEDLTKRPTVSILAFKNKSNIPTEVADKIALNDASITSDFVLERLWQSGKFRIIDREDVEEALKEMSLQQSGFVNPAMVLSVGKLLGAQYIIRGSVTNVSFKKTPVEMTVENKASGKFNKTTITANISLRFVNVETGETVLAVSGVGESSRGDAELSIDEKFYEKQISVETEAGSSSVTISEKIVPYKLIVGSSEISQLQVRNALYKAVIDAIENNKYGVMAWIKGKGKERKV